MDIAAVREPLKILKINQTTEVYIDHEESIQDRREVQKKASVRDILKLEQKWNLKKAEMATVRHEGWAAGVKF
jgi:hypothetical protein